MGLDAYVRCDCIKRGRTSPHPCPELLVFDSNREPVLKNGASLSQWVSHDRWLEGSCQHGGIKVSIRIGNISHVAELREAIRHIGVNEFPILLNRVLCSGGHSGDSIPVRMIPKLQRELKILRQQANVELALQFIKSMERLCNASVKTCNPIVF